MRLRLLKKRRALIDYASAITINVEPAVLCYRIGLLTGALALTIADNNPKDGDEIILLFMADGTQRTVTLSGLASGSVVVALNTASVIRLIYHEGFGKYLPAVLPT